MLRRVGDTGLDVLCCNAAVMHAADVVTEDGFDIQMQTNQIGHYVLVAKLWPALAKAGDLRGEARVIMHSSAARYFDGAGGGMYLPPSWGKKLDGKYFEKHAAGELGGEGWPVPGKMLMFNGPKETRYQQSKLANFAFTYALADKIAAAGSKVKSIAARGSAEMSRPLK